MRELTIGRTTISDAGPCVLIAEIGHNHGGSVDTALALIKQMAAAGAWAVKLQKRHNATLYTPQALAQPYENEHSYGPTYGEHRAALELGWKEYVSCRAVARAYGLEFFATAFDEPSADFLLKLGVPALKIASGDLTNTPLLRYVAGLGVPLVVSTGGGSLEDVERAVEAIGPCPHALLHCTASYPLQPQDANLRAILALRQRFPDTIIGWSSHHPGIALSLIAAAFGARILEHHVTLNRAGKGTDHGFSLEPKGVQTLIEDLGKVRAAEGLGEKVRLACEAGPLRKMAKSLYLARDLPAGAILRREDLVRQSPADGLPPYLLDAVIGFPLTRAVHAHEPLTFDHIEGRVRA